MERVKKWDGRRRIEGGAEKWSRESRRGITKEGYQSRENGGEMVEIGIRRVEHGGGKRGGGKIENEGCKEGKEDKGHWRRNNRGG